MATILLVVGDKNALTGGDTFLRDRLLGKGHTVVLRSDEETELATGYDGIVAGDSCSSGTLGSKYATIAKPAISTEFPAWGFGTLTSGVASANWTVTAGTALSAGLSGTVAVLGGGSTSTDGAAVANVGAGVVVATNGGSTAVGPLVYWETGAAMAAGQPVAPARRALFRVGDSAIVNLTASGLSLLDAAIDWSFPAAGTAHTRTVTDTAGGADTATRTHAAARAVLDPASGADTATAGGANTLVLNLTSTPAGVVGDPSAGGWDDTSSASTTYVLGAAPAGAPVELQRTDADAAANYDVLLGTWVSAPMTAPGEILAGTSTRRVLTRAGVSGVDLRLRTRIYVITSTGTVRGQALNVTGGSNSFIPTTPTGLSATSTISATVACQVGDRLVVELGFRQIDATATPATASIWAGGTDPTPQVPGGTDVNDPGYIEIDAASLFGAGPVDHTRTVVDQAGGGDTATAAAAYARAVADPAAGVDTATAAQAHARAVADPASAVDGVATEGSFVQSRTATDTAGGADTVAVEQAHSRGPLDTAAATDTLAQATTSARGVADTATATDAATAAVGRARAVADPAGAVDAISVVHGIGHARSVTDTATATDTTARQLAAARALTDPAAGTDRVQVKTSYAPVNVSLWAVTPTGLAPLPAPRKLDFSRERNAPGSVEVEYAANAPRASLLRAGQANDTHVEVEIWVDGSRTGALRARLEQTGGDDHDGRAVWTFAGHFLEQLLDGALVYPQPTAEKGELLFTAAAAGRVMATVLGQAQARGALTSLTRDWTTTTDSTGQPWPTTVSGLKFAPKTTLLQVAQELAELDLADFEITRDRVLRMWAPGRRGVDRTSGTEPAMFRHGRVKGAPLRHDVRKAGTSLLVLGADGKYAEVNDAAALARRGERIERAVDAGQLTDTGALLAYGQAAKPTVTTGQREYRHDLVFGPGDPRPGAGFDLADVVLSERAGGVRVPVRLQQYTLAVAAGTAVSGEVVLGDRIASRAERILRQLEAIRSGVVIAGTSAPRADDDVLAPSAPTGLSATSIAYQDDEHSQTLAAVTLSWALVATNAPGPNTAKAQAAQLILQRMQSGLPIFEDWTWAGAPPVVGEHNDALLSEHESSGVVNEQQWLAAYVTSNSSPATAADDVAGYHVQMAYLGLAQVGGILNEDPDETLLLNWAQVTPSSGVAGPPYTFSGVEAGVRIGLRVAAFDNSGNVSDFSTVLELDTAVDNVAPERAAAPTLNTWFRTLDITSNGLDIFGAPMPVDYDHDEIWVSRAAIFTVPPGASTPVAFDPAALGAQHVANLTTAGTWNQPDLTIGVGYYAARRSVDRSGNAGPLSPIAGPATAEQLVQIDIGPGAIGRQQIIDLEVIRAKIGNLAVNSAKVEEIQAGLVTTGTLIATVTLTGLIRTASTGLRWEGDPAGIRFYNSGGQLTINLQGASGSALLTGTVQSAMSGERWVMDPDGTLRLYPASGTNFNAIYNEGGGGLIFRSGFDGSNRAGYLYLRSNSAQISYGTPGTLIHASRLQCSINASELWGGQIVYRADRNFGTVNRHTFTQFEGNSDIANTVLYLQDTGGSGQFPWFHSIGGNSGFIFGPNYMATSNVNGSLIELRASNVAFPSSRRVKQAERAIGWTRPGRSQPVTALDVVRGVVSKEWEYLDQAPGRRPKSPGKIMKRQFDGIREVLEQVDAAWSWEEKPAPKHYGPMAEDLAELAPDLVIADAADPSKVFTDVRDLLGVVWEAVRILDQKVDGKLDNPIRGVR